jgi:hypothetical protein
MGHLGVGPRSERHVIHPHFKHFPSATQAIYQQVLLGLNIPQPLVFALHLAI